MKKLDFKSFIEGGGYYDDTTGSVDSNLTGRGQPLPGLSMAMRTNEIQGKVTRVKEGNQRDRMILRVVQGDGKEIDLHIPKEKYLQDRETAPRFGDTLHAEFDKNGSILSYSVIHRA